MRQPTPIPPRLETARQRFDDWRRTRQATGDMPGRCLGPSAAGTQPELTFFELAPSARPASTGPAGVPECILECENVGGAKLRVQLRGVGVPDLVALSRSFWSAEA